MGGSDSDYSDSSSTSARSFGGSKVKKDKKDKKKDKEKKDKKDKKDKKGDDHKDKDKKDDKKDKDKDKDKKDKKKDKHSVPQPGYSYAYHGQQEPAQPSSSSTSGIISVPAFNPNYPGALAAAAHDVPGGPPTKAHPAMPSAGIAPSGVSSFPQPTPPTGMSAAPSAPPPGYPGPPPSAPPSGYRVPLDNDKPFPRDIQEVGPPVASDADGSPVFVGSALFDNSVHPCKIVPQLTPPARVPYGGRELAHSGRYDLLPFVPNEMEWVPASHGQIPHGRRPVEGGYEDNGAKLYHALATVHGVQVPGKTGEHLGGAAVPFGGSEHNITQDYRILVWRY